MRKPTCMLDTNVLIHLSGIELARKKAGMWLWEAFNVSISEAVKAEIQNHSSSIDSTVLRKACNSRSTKVVPDRDVDGVRLAMVAAWKAHLVNDKPQPTPPAVHYDRNRGEWFTVAALLQSVTDQRSGHYVLMIDDEKATRNFVPYFVGEIPVACFWDVYDFLVYTIIRFRNHITPLQVSEAIKNVTANIAKASGSGFTSGWSTDRHRRAINKLALYGRII